MADFGNWTPITFVNAGPPAIDEDAVNDIESWIDNSDEELRKSATVNFKDIITYFYERNIKEIEDFTDYTEWTPDASATLSDDTANNVIGPSAVKILEKDNVASWCGMDRNIASMDLTIFHDGTASSTADLIMTLFYITDITKYILFMIKLGTSNGNHYQYQWNPAGFTNGWNFIFIPKASFTTVGAPSGWDDITYLRVDSYTTINALNSYITVQYMQMIRVDPDYANYSNAFQEYFGAATGWINKFEVFYDLCTIVYDSKINRLGIMKLIAENVTGGLHIYCSVLSFQSRFEIYSKLAGYTNNIMWVVDANNYAEVYISANTFYLNVVEAAASTVTSIALANNLLLNERVIISFEKDNTIIRAILEKCGEPIKILEYETTITSDGCVHIGTAGSSSWGLVTDFSISSNVGSLQLGTEQGKNSKIYLLPADISYVNNTITAIPAFLIRLKPNRVYKIETLLLLSNAGSSTAQFRTDWDYAGDILSLGSRRCIGGDATAAASDPEGSKIRFSVHALATDVRWAVKAGTTYSLATETYILKTMQAGAYMQLRGAQWNTDGANPTVLRAYSSVIVTELFE